MQEFLDRDKTHATHVFHIQFVHLRTMMKEGNGCPRSVKFCLQRQRLKNPQQDQNQLNGNERVPVVCVRNL